MLLGCGARTGLQQPDAGWDVPRADAIDVIDGSTPDVPDVVTPRDRPDVVDACVPVRDRCGDVERCGDGADDDCDGQVDEGCPCVAGSVQPCFAGPPGRRGVGVCRDGTQVCLGSGAWGACLGGISPRADVCNGADNLCDGCSAQSDCEIQCPSPGDPRTPDALPLRAYPLRGTAVLSGRGAALGVVGGGRSV